MSAFADPDSTTVVELETCYCPDKPHEHDTVTIRTEYGYGDAVALSRVHTDAGRIDPMAERVKLLELAIVAWSFLGKDGTPAPVGLPMILLLKPEIIDPVREAVDKAWEEANVPLPNGSSGPSQPSSPEMDPASVNRATRRSSKRSGRKSNSVSAGPTNS